MDTILFILLIIILVLVWLKMNNVENLLLDMRENGLHESLQMSISEESIQSIVDLVLTHLDKKE